MLQRVQITRCHSMSLVLTVQSLQVSVSLLLHYLGHTDTITLSATTQTIVMHLTAKA